MTSKKNPAAKADQAVTPNLTAAIVEGLAELGHDVETAKVKGWIADRYPGLKTDVSSFQSTLSLKRKTLREGGNGRKPQSAVSKAPHKGELTVSQLLRVKETVVGQGGVDSVLKAVQSVQGLAQGVGGMDKLSEALAALKKLEK